MLITTFDQIKQLFESETPESQYLDYKSQLYCLTTTQPGSEAKRNKDKQEVLKDVGGFLNSNTGVILLGVAENAGTGAPQTTIENAGIPDADFPEKYDEILGAQITRGFSPICQIDIRKIPNQARSGHSFLVINILSQHSPLFSVINDQSGNIAHALFIRRGRNIGRMEPREIENRISTFSKINALFPDRVAAMVEKYKAQRLKPILMSYPLIPLNIPALDYKEHLRGENTWESGHSKVTYNELNAFAQPTLEGIEILHDKQRLHLYEDGFITWEREILHHTEISFVDHADAPILSNRFLIDQDRLTARILNFARFALHTYHKLGYLGEFVISLRLFQCEGSYLCMSPSDYRSTFAEASQYNGYLDLADENNYYGPKVSKSTNVAIDIRLSTAQYGPDKLSELDVTVKKQILDYIWRAYGFDSCILST